MMSIQCFCANDGAWLQKALKERGIDTMLEEARADNRDNDVEYMKPSGKS